MKGTTEALLVIIAMRRSGSEDFDPRSVRALVLPGICTRGLMFPATAQLYHANAMNTQLAEHHRSIGASFFAIVSPGLSKMQNRSYRLLVT